LYNGTAPIINANDNGKQKTIAKMEFEIIFTWKKSVPKSFNDAQNPTISGSNNPKVIESNPKPKAIVFTFLNFALFTKFL
jgi:hypothetical protein